MIEKKEINKLLNFKSVVRPKSLMVTIMGDVVGVHGKQIWSGNLIQMCNWFDITEHSSRVSLQRLVQEGWFKKYKDSFYVYYEFTKFGWDTFHLHQSVIYQRLSEDWKGSWQVVIIRKDNSSSANLIKDISLAGYRKLYKNIYCFPGNNLDHVKKLVKRYNLDDQVVFMNGNMMDLKEGHVIDNLVTDTWDTTGFSKLLNDFLDKISRLDASVMNKIVESPEMSLYTRLKLIHEYRRFILKHNRLPQKLYKQQPLLNEIYDRMAKLYQQLSKGSIIYVTKKMRGPNGFMPKADRAFSQRFQPSKVLPNTTEQLTRLSTRNLRAFLK